MMKRKNKPSVSDIPWESTPQTLRAKEYFKYFDVDAFSDNVKKTETSALHIMSHKDLRNAVDNDISDDESELILFDSSKKNGGLYSAYVVPTDIEALSLKRGDIAILDINKKCFDGNGFYVLNTSGRLDIKYIVKSDDIDFLIIEAKLCEIRRTL